MKSFTCILTFAFLLPTVAARAQDALPERTLTKLKAATVFVKTKGPGQERRGTGFLVRKKGKIGWVVTNAHVLGQSGESDPVVEVVFHSGDPDELVLTGALAARDDAQDLAVLRVEAPRLPLPIDKAPKKKVDATLPVYILGFPLGEALAMGRSNPGVTVSKGSVSSVRKDSDGRIEAVQIDGEFNPGNSGGPVVDAAGGLVGIATAKVSGTHISFAIPHDKLQEMFGGRVRAITLSEKSNARGAMTLDVSADLSDPVDAVSRVAVLIAPKKPNDRLDRDSRGRYTALKGAKVCNLQKSRGAFRGEIKLQNRSTSAAEYWVQTRYVRGKNDNQLMEPRELSLTFDQSAPARKAKENESDGPEDGGEENADADAEAVPPAKDSETKTPAVIDEALVAGGGRYLVLKLREMPALAVYDTWKGEMAGNLRLPSSQFVYAAGGDLAVVYFDEDNLLQTWDLAKLEKKLTKPNPVSGRVKNLLMGSARGDQAVVQFQASGSSTGDHYLLNTRTLQPVNKGGQPVMWRGHHSYFEHPGYLRANRDLTILTEWSRSGSPSGVTVHTRRGNEFTAKNEHTSAGFLAPGEDNRIYTGIGDLYSTDAVKVGSISGQSLFPGVGGGFYLGLRQEDGRISVYPCGKASPLCQWGVFPDWNKESQDQMRYVRSDAMPPDRRIVFLPTIGRIVMLPLDNQRVVMKKFDLKATLDESGIDYLVVTSAPPPTVQPRKAWKYQIHVLSKAGKPTYKLDFAPQGMKVSEDGLITWKPPAKLPPQGEKVVVLIRDAGEEELFHSFTLHGPGGAGASGGSSGSGNSSGAGVHRIEYGR